MSLTRPSRQDARCFPLRVVDRSHELRDVAPFLCERADDRVFRFWIAHDLPGWFMWSPFETWQRFGSGMTILRPRSMLSQSRPARYG